MSILKTWYYIYLLSQYKDFEYRFGDNTIDFYCDDQLIDNIIIDKYVAQQ